MKYAKVGGSKTEASKGMKGECYHCGSLLIAKCGDIKAHHWSHHSKSDCDHWWENESEWHRGWKNFFPKDWQEITHFDEYGEKHIADVKTNHSWIIEFQHSYLKNEEKVIRSDFYNKVIWVVDGTRRKNDIKQFNKALQCGSSLQVSVPIYRVTIDDCSLIKEWVSLKKPLFLDFKEASRVWMIVPSKHSEYTYVIPYSREDFVKLHNDQSNNDVFGVFLKEFLSMISRFENQRQLKSINIPKVRNFRRARRNFRL